MWLRRLQIFRRFSEDMAGRPLACVDMFVRVRSRCDGQIMRDPAHGFNGLYRGG
jgi:hypothetical protein